MNPHGASSRSMQGPGRQLAAARLASAACGYARRSSRATPMGSASRSSCRRWRARDAARFSSPISRKRGAPGRQRLGRDLCAQRHAGGLRGALPRLSRPAGAWTLAEIGRWRKSGGGLRAACRHGHEPAGSFGGRGDGPLPAGRMARHGPRADHDASWSRRKSRTIRSTPSRRSASSAWPGCSRRIKQRSLANSSGHFLPSLPQFELTRAAMRSNGGNPTPGQPNPMQPDRAAGSVHLQIRLVEAGESVGLQRSLDGQTQIAHRHASIAMRTAGCAPCQRRTAEKAVLMRWCMACAVDRRALLHGPCDDRHHRRAVGRRAGGANGHADRDPISVDDVAAAAGTNGYEILTSLGGRYQRKVVNV